MQKKVRSLSEVAKAMNNLDPTGLATTPPQIDHLGGLCDSLGNWPDPSQSHCDALDGGIR